MIVMLMILMFAHIRLILLSIDSLLCPQPVAAELSSPQ